MSKASRAATVIFDGRRAFSDSRTGIDNYARQVLLNWPEDSHHNVVALSRVNSHAVDLEYGLQSRALRGRGFLWHLSALLFYLSNRPAVYYSPESMLVPAMIGARATVTIHDITPIRNPDRHTRWNVFLHRVLLKIVLSRVGSVVVPTSAVREDLLQFSPAVSDKVVVVHEGVRTLSPTQRTVSPPARYPRSLLYVGTIEPRKNVLTLINTFLGTSLSDWTLTIVGKIGWLNERDKEEFEKLVESESVAYRGFVDDEELENLYRKASAFVYIPQAEGFGLPVIEALAYGLPVIHTDDPALLEVSSGFPRTVVERVNLPSALGLALHRLKYLQDSDLDDRLAIQSQICRKFDWSQTATGILSVALARG